MIVFETFLKILNKCKTPIIIYTLFLIIFSVFNTTINDSPTTFVASKPDVAIINRDEDKGITASLIDYIEKGSNIEEFSNDDALSDALFYREINYIIEIPVGFGKDFILGRNPEIKVKSTGDYQASLAQMRLDRYLKTIDTYRLLGYGESEIIASTEKILATEIDVTITSKLDISSLSKMSSYYNFVNYCLLAGAIFIITLVMATFKEEKVSKRTIISSMDYKKFNRNLLWANALFTIVLWLFYVIISFILIGRPMFSIHGALLVLNSFIFSFCALSIAFLLGNVVKNKEAVNGIVNVIALGSSFLCGAFVPLKWLPDSVLSFAHILPSYWFIATNELIKDIESFTWLELRPLFANMLVILGFTLLFVIITNIITKKKRRS